MAIPSSGPIKLSDIRKEFGGDSDPSMSEYSGDDIANYPLPADGEAISFSDFRGLDFDVVEMITEDGTWNASGGKASKVHVFVVGPGGSGAAARADTNVGFFRNTDGVAAAGGGSAGGVAYQVYDIDDIGSIQFTIPEGGAPVTASGEGVRVLGNTPTALYTEAKVYNKSGGLIDTLRGWRGYGGGGAWSTSGGGDTATTNERVGGFATGGDDGNFEGGTVGTIRISKSGAGIAASGGSCPAFLTQHETLNNVDSINTGSTSTFTEGAKVSNFLNYPNILTNYLGNLGLSQILGSSVTDFDGGDAGANGGDAVYGAGGGGAGGMGDGSTSTSGKGGDGVAIIVYEIN